MSPHLAPRLTGVRLSRFKLSMTLKDFKPGLILTPPAKRTIPRLTRLPLAGPGAPIVTPATLDARSRLLRSSNQGPSSECVLNALCGLAEFINWREHGTTAQLDPHPAYLRAKLIDGMPDVEGTTLEAGLQAMIDLGLISGVDAASIRGVSNPADVMRALHVYDVMLCAFTITSGWFKAGGDGWVIRGGAAAGGHAVLGVGYSIPQDFFSFQNSWADTWGNRGFGRISWGQFNEEFQYGLIFDRKLAA